MNPNTSFFSDQEVDALYKILYYNYSRITKDFGRLVDQLAEFDIILKKSVPLRTLSPVLDEYVKFVNEISIMGKDLKIFQKEVHGLLNTHPTPEDIEKCRKNWEDMR